MAAFAGVDLDRGYAGFADALGVVTGLLIALDHRQRQVGAALAQGHEGAAQQGGLAGTGAGHQIEGQYAVGGEVFPVTRGVPVVFAEDVLLQADGAGLAHAGH